MLVTKVRSLQDIYITLSDPGTQQEEEEEDHKFFLDMLYTDTAFSQKITTYYSVRLVQRMASPDHIDISGSIPARSERSFFFLSCLTKCAAV